METINQAHRALPLSPGESGNKASRARTALLALVLLFGCMPALADQFYFTRVRAFADAQGGATGLFSWNDVTGAQSQIGGSGAVYLRHATDGAISVGGIAASSGGILYGFAADDAATAGLLPFTSFDCRSTIRSRLVTINTSTAVITYVGAYLPSRYVVSAAFDGTGRLWAYDCVASEVVQIDPATGATIGTAIATGVPTSIAVGIDFAANGLGIIGYSGLLFQTFDPDTGQVGAVPVVAQNNGFDGALVPPYAIAGVAFTNNLAARNGSPAAQDCRLNLQEHRGLDELGHANDPFFANPVIAFREAEELNPGTVAAGWFNGGPGDMTRAGGPALPDCFFDWGDAPASYATLRANNGARHAVAGPYLGSALPDFEVDGQAGPATGDDNIGTDDETGVAIPTLTRGATIAIAIDAGNVGAGTRLQGWIDWDGDGSFTQPGDRILTDATVVAGANTFNVNVPITAAVGTTYARFRIADQGALSFDGAADSGEVEDHAILVTAGEPLLTKTFAAASIPYGGSAALTFTIDNTAAGSVNQTGMAFTDNLPVGLMIATPANVASTCTGATVTANAGTSTITVSGASVPAAQTCTISVDVTNRPGYTGICYDPNFANENQNITGLNNLAAAIAQFTCLSVEPPDCPSADYTNGFDNIGGLSPNLNNGVSGQCLALLPTITLNKISEAGTGSFDFTFGNTDATNPVTIVTTAPSMPEAAGPFNVLDLAQPVTIAETGLPAGWMLSSIACVTDGGDAIGSFDAGTATWTVSPDELASGQQITCTALNLAPAAIGTVKALNAESGSEPGVAEPGEQLTYTITLTNTGGVDATNYPVTDVLDPNVTFVSADNGGTLAGGNVEWTGLTVPAGGSLVLTVVVEVVAPIPAGVTAIGNVAYTPTDPPPDCDVTPTPPNCVIIPTPDPIDFGDAPDSYGTLLASNGARHVVLDLDVGTNTASLMLGATIDAEVDGAPDATALSDDGAGIDDENAVGAMPDMAVTQTVYAVTVAVRNTTGTTADLVGWVDWNRNGVFDTTEAATATVADGATSATLNWAGLSLTPLIGNTYARLRIAPAGEIDPSTPIGEASAGEVEDHIVRLIELPDTFGSCPVNDLPPPTNFTIRQRWTTPNVAGQRVIAYQTPVVGDLFGNGQPVVVVAADNSFTNVGLDGRLAKDLHIVNGSNGVIIDTITTPLFGWSGHAVVAIADVDADGQGEIILKVTQHANAPAAVRGRLIAYRNDGTQMWLSDQRYDYAETNGRGGVALGVADFNGDGVPEAYVGNQIFNAQTGVRLVTLTSAASAGCPHRASANVGCYWGQSTAADMDGDGLLELVAGNIVYKVDITNPNGAAGNTITNWRQATASAGVGDGFTAVADIDLDGDPDVVVSRTVDATSGGAARIYVWDGQTATVMGMLANIGTNGGPPLLGDIDGDGTAEIVAVTTTNLRAFKYQAGTLVSKWTAATNDTSGLTSLSMFDFNNDGTRELVYRDQDNIRIINGSGAAAADLATFACGSGTATEMPVIAALDSTRQARILVTCAASAGIQGQLRAYETNSFPWANTRPVWNQQAYFVTHVNNDLTIPSEQYPHWTAFNDPGQLCSSGINRPLNAFQQQVTDLDPNSGCPAVCAVADVDVSKALTTESGTLPGLAEAGEQLTYTITLTNSGGLDATNYPVTDQLDPNVTFVSASHGGTLVGGNVEWTGLTVPAAGSLQLTVVVQVVDPIPDGVTQIGNVAYSPTDPPPACDTTPLPPNCTVTPTEPKIGIGKALTGENGSVPGLAEPGELLTYTITLTNTGGTDATNYGITDALDANVVFVSASNGGALVGGNVEWSGLTVPAGGSLALTVTVQVVNPIPLGVTEVSNVAYETGTPQPNCDVTPLPANCVVIPTPEPLDCGLNVEQTISGFAQAWTPGSTWQNSPGNTPAMAINAPDGSGVQLWFNQANVLTLDMSTVVPANEFVTLHLSHPGGFVGPVQIESSPDGVTFGGAITRTLSAIVPAYEPVNYFVPPGGARFIRITPLTNGGTGTAVRVDALTYSFEFCECADTLNWVRQGSFEEFPICSLQTGTFGDWSVIGANVHIWGQSCPGGWPSPDGLNSVDLDGGTTGGLQQVISGLTVGNRYNLTFYQSFNPAAGAPSASMRVQIGDFSRIYTSASSASAPGGGFNRVYIEFTAQSTTETLRFESLTGSGLPGLLNGGGSPGFGVVIDDVRITPQDCSELPPALVEIDKELTGENGSVPDVAEAGEQLTYTITLTNSGGLDATNYPVTDQLDPNVTFVSASNGGTLVGGNVEWTGLTVPAGGSLVLTVVVQVVDPIPPGVLEIGNVAYTPTDPPPDCDVTPTPPNCTITPTEPNVTTGKALTGESGTQAGIAEPGEQLTYTITLTNSGGTDATNYPQVDQLDPNVTFVSASNGGTLVGTQVQWTGLTVPANGSLVLTVVVQVVDPIPDGVLAIGNVAYDPTEPPPNCDVTPRPPNCTVTPTPPQLRVEKSIIAESLTLDGIAEPGEELTYSVRVRNVGGTDALNRIVNESVPANTVYVALGSDAWSCADGSGPGTPCDFTVATVPAAGFVDLLFRVRIDDPIPPGVTQIANAVALDGEIPPTCPPNAGDPQDPACVVIPTVPQTVVAKALTAESLGQNGQAEAGEVLTYTITVTNHGGTDDTNVVVNEIVPDYTVTAPGNQTVNGALGNWTCADLSGPGTACDLTLALVPSGGSVTLEFLLRVDDPIPDGVTQIANSVALNGDPPPPCPPAGGQCVITPTEPSVSVVKTLLLEDGTQTGVVEAGETLVYQLQVTNSGGSAALAEFLREIVPEHTTFVADPVSSPGWTCADGSPNPTVCDLVFDIGPLQTLNFLFAVEAADPIPDGVREIANGIGLGGNPPPCPPPGIHCVVTPTANLSNDKTVVSVTPVGANSYRVTYQIVMTNTGGAPATYTLSDQLSYPATGVTLLSPAIASTADGVLEPTLAANNGQFTPVNNTPVQLSAIDVPLAVGESDTYVVALTIAVDPAQVSNGTCTGAPGNGLYNSAVAVGTADAEDDACVPVPTDAPRISLIKRNRLLDGNGNGYGDVGEPLEYRFEIANSGSTALSSVRLIDAKIRPPQGAWVQCDRPGTPGSGSFVFSAPVEVGGTIICTATYALSATDVSVRRVTNTANVTALAPDGRQVRASATSIFENFQ